ncbi:Polyol transporter 5 [Hibiscus syriacus]|uniref:Polyol transporter 5 n=1 Tax=Hibiscus syriacus TaxID=106335 RepID=A0A6A3AH66_HIBSY|nr:putative polyol transporter 1 [Hibiscus syriacus]KAE8703123.1 Polyol transporter 5 [Hibiscus syriacus]
MSRFEVGNNGVSIPTAVDNKALADFEPPKKPKRNKFAFVCAILASLASILLGYDIGVMSGAIIFIKDDLKISDVQVEILVGILNLYCLLGAYAAGRTSDWIGRRYTIVVAAAIFFAGAFLMGFATNYAFLMVGRFVAGIGVGYAMMIAPVYTAELSPASSRGFLTSFPEVFINIGLLLGYISNYAFSKLRPDLGWRVMLGAGAVPSFFLAIGGLTMPESPRWLIMQGRLGEAKRVLDRTSDTKEEAQLRLSDIKEAAGIPQDCTDDVVQVQKQSHGEGVWRELFLHPTPAVRHVMICAIGIHFFQQAIGLDSVVLYSPRIFEKAGITSSNHKLLATIAVGFCKMIFILVATFLLDRIGRRPLLLSSIAGVAVSLATLGLSLTIINHSNHRVPWAIGLCIAMVLTAVSVFSIGMGPIAWVYSTEIFPLRLRAQGASIGVGINRAISGVISMSFISLYKAITIGGAFFLYAGIATVAFFFFFACFPETQGKTLEETEALFGKLIGWREEAKKIRRKRKMEEDNSDRSNKLCQLELGNDITTDSKC